MGGRSVGASSEVKGKIKVTVDSVLGFDGTDIVPMPEGDITITKAKAGFGI